jgi:hypothetical protein
LPSTGLGLPFPRASSHNSSLGTKAVGRGSVKCQFLKDLGNLFDRIYILIYFDAYILKKHAEFQISCRKYENIDFTSGLTFSINHIAFITLSSNDE